MMIKKIGVLSTMLLICGLVMSPGYAQAILIENAGFEDPNVVEDEWTVGAVPNWGIYTENMTNDYWYGVWKPTAADYPGGVPDGNVGYIETRSLPETGIVGFEQTLSANLMANTTYELQVDIGNPLWGDNERWQGFPGYRIELLAGDDSIERLAWDDNIPSPDDGAFGTSTVSFTVGSDHDKLGQALAIRLLNISAGAGREVDFDNVSLTATPIATPEPATMLLLGTGLIGLAGFGRKKFKKK